MLSKITGKLTDPAFVVAVVVLFIVLRMVEVRDVFGVSRVISPTAG